VQTALLLYMRSLACGIRVSLHVFLLECCYLIYMCTGSTAVHYLHSFAFKYRYILYSSASDGNGRCLDAGHEGYLP
jgi:hypothetical protein